MADYMAMVGELRQAGIRAEVYLGNPKNFGNQLKYADKRGSPVAVIQGGNEAAAGTVILKDLILGAKIAESATLEEWKDRPAQVEVPRADLVAAVSGCWAHDPDRPPHRSSQREGRHRPVRLRRSSRGMGHARAAWLTPFVSSA